MFSPFSQKRIISTTSLLNNEEYGRVVINNDDEIESKPTCRETTGTFKDCMGCALAKLWDFNDWKSFTMCTISGGALCIAAAMIHCLAAPVMPPDTGDTDIIIKNNGYYKLIVNTGSVFLFN